MYPKVSVIIPTYNLAKILIERSIASVLNQTYKNLECLVIDDGSTDDTEIRVRQLMEKDHRLFYFKTNNKGQSAAKNLGVEKTTGDFIAFNDHDDEYLPNYLQLAIEQFRQLPDNFSYLSSSVINRDEWGRESYYLPQLEPFWKLSVGNGWIFRREVFKESNIDTDPAVSNFEDLDLHLKLRQHGYKGYVIDQLLRIYYVRIQSSSSALSLKAYHQRQANSFNHFFELHKDDYKNFGREAISWLCFFGGLIYSRSGNLKKGRYFLEKSFYYKPSLLTGIYFGSSLFGYRVFNIFDNLKNRIMRFIKVKFK